MQPVDTALTPTTIIAVRRPTHWGNGTLDLDAAYAIDRRRFLRSIAAMPLVGLSAPLFAQQTPKKIAFGTHPFTLGVASGDPAPDGFVIWTRLAPMPLQADGGLPKRTIEVDWAVATDERMQQVVRTGSAIAYPEAGHSGIPTVIPPSTRCTCTNGTAPPRHAIDCSTPWPMRRSEI